MTDWGRSASHVGTEGGSGGGSEHGEHALLNVGFSFNKILLRLFDKFLFDATVQGHGSEEEGGKDCQLK